ncbi:MAG: NAD(P) transhydrogenase subunit alpha [Planctomycetales bacterium]|nr:NAD(P) transhydrogenase subunit alpha [Planctomycetales bacterium]
MTGPAGLLGSAVAEDDITTPKGDAGDAGTQAADDSESSSRTAALIASLTIFVLAVFVGFEIITKVPPTLHTPLMSGSNAISGITLVGALLVAGGVSVGASRVWGFLAVVLATVNVVGGFLVTHRMLAMFNKPRR